MLPLAYDIAYACRSDPLLEPLSRVDMDWLLALLGRAAPDTHQAEVAAPAQRTTTRETPIGADQPYIELPPRATRPAEPPARSTPPTRPAEPPGRETPGPARPRPAEPPARSTPPTRPAEPPGRETPGPASGRPAGAQGSRQQKFGFEPPRKQEPQPPVERSSTPAPPPQPPANPPELPPDEEGPPDAAALIARLRRQRQQRETQPGPARPKPAQRSGRPGKQVTARFQAGDRIFCLPYGDGTVRESRIEGDRELLMVDFPEHGELEIDPVVNLVRIIEERPNSEDDLL
jgi:hypothetical protein